MVIAAMKLKDTCSLVEKAMTNLDSILKSRDIVCQQRSSNQSYGFSSSHVWIKSWTIKKAEHQRIDSFKVWYWNRLLRVPWTARRSNQVHPKENLSWIFIGKTDAEAETLVLWPLIWRTDSLEKTDAGKDWRQEEKGTTEDEMVGWHHWLDGNEFEQAPGVGDG